MDWNLIVGCTLLILARIADVTLGTIRTISVVNGRAYLAWFLGFFEILVWITAVSKVIQNLDTPAYAVCYALGYATGNFVGVRLEQRLAMGLQVVRVFSHHGAMLAGVLREAGFRVTEFVCRGQDGEAALLFVETRRRDTPRVLREASSRDPECFYLVDDIRQASSPSGAVHAPTGWRAIVKKK